MLFAVYSLDTWRTSSFPPSHPPFFLSLFFLSHVIFLEYVDILMNYFLCDTVCLFISNVTFFFNFRKIMGFIIYSVSLCWVYILSSSTVLMLRILPVFNIFSFPWIFFSFFLIFIVFLFDLLFYLLFIVFISYCYFFFVPCIFGLRFSFIF